MDNIELQLIYSNIPNKTEVQKDVRFAKLGHPAETKGNKIHNWYWFKESFYAITF